MLELVVTICLMHSCKDMHLSYVENMTPYWCAAKAQAEIAKLPLPPGYKITRWKCQRVKPDASA